MMKCRYRCAYSRGRKKERCVCVYKNGVGWRRALFFRSYRFVMINGKGHGEKRIKKRQREIQNAKWITNKKREKKDSSSAPKMSIHCVDFTSHFYFYFFLIFQPKNSPFQFPTGFECSQFWHIFGDPFFWSLPNPPPPPLQGIEKKRSSTDRRPRSYKVCAAHRHTDDCVTKY